MPAVPYTRRATGPDGAHLSGLSCVADFRIATVFTLRRSCLSRLSLGGPSFQAVSYTTIKGDNLSGLWPVVDQSGLEPETLQL